MACKDIYYEYIELKTQALYRSRVIGGMANHMGHVKLVVGN